MRPEIQKLILKKIKEDYKFLAKEFSEKRTTPWSEFIDFKKFIKERENILDVGCGNGRFYNAIKDKNIVYTGVDNSKELIEIAKEKYKNEIEKKEEKFIIGEAFNLPFKNDTFDKVFCLAVIHHIPSKYLRVKALNEIKRVLRKGGLLLMMNWNLYQIKYLPIIIKYSLIKIFNRKLKFNREFNILGKDLDFKDVFVPWRTQDEKIIFRYYHAFTKLEINKLLKKSGFKILENYYSKRGKRTNFIFGYNLVTIGEKL